MQRAVKDKVDVIIDPSLLLRLWDPSLMTEYNKFRVDNLETLPGSFIEYYKNGVSMGIAFTNLKHGNSVI